jgi:hypothetical protein
MKNPNQADKLEESPVSENQDKTVDVYFGIFFDAIDMSLAAHYFNREEYLRKGEDAVSDVKNSSTYGTVNEVAAWADFATDVLPDNPVSKAVNTALEVKSTIENKVDDVFGKVNTVNDDVSDKMGKIPTSFGSGTDGNKSEGDAGESLIGSRSIISKMEPNYVGGVPSQETEEKDYGVKVTISTSGDVYNFRIYTTGAVTNQEIKQKEPANAEEEPQISEDARKQLAQNAIEDVKNAVNQKIAPCPPKLFLHFDVFGYEKDPAANDFISEIDKFKQNPKVIDLSTDYNGGLFENFHSKDEVKSKLGDTSARFRNLDKL